MIIYDILKDAIHYGVSDIHIQIDSSALLNNSNNDDSCIYFRVRKNILPYLYHDENNNSRDTFFKDIYNEIYTLLKNQDINYSCDIERSISVSLDSIRCRVSSFVADNMKTCFTIRLLDSKIPTLESINAPKSLSSLAMQQNGLILVCGATGSGKSTTLAAMINHINTNCNKHIITIEDPIEYYHKNSKSLITQREIGSNTKDFLSALEASLRHDPDVILIGEILDSKVLRLAINHALSGHLVFASFHANNCTHAISRMIGMCDGDLNARSNLSECLQGIITQRLYETNSKMQADFEIMIASPAIKVLIKEDKIWQIDSQITMGKSFGMQHFGKSI